MLCVHHTHITVPATFLCLPIRTPKTTWVVGFKKNVLPTWAVDVVAQLGFVTHYQSITRGLLDTRDVIYFASLIVIGLALNTIVLQLKKAQ